LVKRANQTREIRRDLEPFDLRALIGISHAAWGTSEKCGLKIVDFGGSPQSP
jgi:hypothetical protein